MIELSIMDTIEQSLIATMKSEDLNKLIQDKIAESLTREMRKHIDEMSFIDMNFNEEAGFFEINAELVLCSKQEIITNAELQAQKMAKYGLGEKEILDVLETQLSERGGF